MAAATLYNETLGIEALAQKHQLFSPVPFGKMVRYKPAPDLALIQTFATKHLGGKVESINAIADSFADLTTDQSEIIATLYACWNDFLIHKHKPTDEEIATEFLLHWHPKKSRFSRSRLLKALAWMRERGWVPKGIGKLTSTKDKR